MLLKHLLANLNFIIFMLLGISMCNELKKKVYPRIIRENRTKRESSLAQKIEVMGRSRKKCTSVPSPARFGKTTGSHPKVPLNNPLYRVEGWETPNINYFMQNSLFHRAQGGALRILYLHYSRLCTSFTKSSHHQKNLISIHTWDFLDPLHRPTLAGHRSV